MYHPTLDEVKKISNEGNLVPIYREIMADMETPVSAFLKINQEGNSFLLESVEGGQRLARYSFIGTSPFKIVKVSSNDKTDPLSLIAAEFNKYTIVTVDGLPRFSGGAVGYLAYEAVKRFEELPSPDSDTLNVPESVFMFVDTMMVFDHIKHTIKVLSHVRLNGDTESQYAAAVEKIDHLIGKLELPIQNTPQSNRNNASIFNSEIKSNFSKEDFIKCVQKIKDYITAGEAIQVVLSQRFSINTEAAPFDVYRALRSINPSPYMFYLDFNDFQIVGASPEILVRVEDGMVMTRPLAGTRWRGKTPEEDIRLEQELRGDIKERAEHIMLVDLGRNDIGKVSEPGSVKVSDLMQIERYSHVMHLVTHVQGKLQKGMTSFDALRACFPAGTVSGAPKIRAMEIIAEVEPDKRGPYAGAVGYFSFSGNMDMAIAIRTMVMKKGIAYIQAGCGVVYDSIPEHEYEESINKAQALLKAMEQAAKANSVEVR
jgi:anthranilate synthase component I